MEGGEFARIDCQQELDTHELKFTGSATTFIELSGEVLERV